MVNNDNLLFFIAFNQAKIITLINKNLNMINYHEYWIIYVPFLNKLINILLY